MLCEPPPEVLDMPPRDSCRTGPSCRALKSAIAALYRLDDFYRERIGSGFFSDVYKVEHKTTGQIMALKMNTDPANRPNVLREIQLMNKLNHPNILKFRGVCVHAGCLHALTEYINGGSLDEWIQDSTKPFVWSLRIKLAIDTARGMGYLHSKDIFHRDLNPKNILIKVTNHKPVAIIADFGLADAIPDKEKRDSVRLPVRGTSWYLAPEILTDKWYDERADVFAFGITLCQLIARISSDPDVLPRTQNYGVDYVAFSLMSGDCPPDFLQFAFKCCLVEPKSRPTFTDAVQRLEDVWRKLRARNELVVGSTRPQPFLDDARVNQGIGCRRRSTSVMQSRPTRRSTSLAYVDLIDINAAQNRCVGEHMKRSDPHWLPVAANPFPSLPEEYRDGTKKIVGIYTSSLCPTVFEVPVPFRAAAAASDNNLSVPLPAFKNYRSCPSSPSASRREFPSNRFAAGGTPGSAATCYESSSWHHCVVSSSSCGNSDVDEELTLKLSGGKDDETLELRRSVGLVMRAVSPDSELAYFSGLSDQSSCDSSTPKSSSRCSNESDGPAPGLAKPARLGRPAPLIRINSVPEGARTKETSSRHCVVAAPRNLYPNPLMNLS
ncbi:Dual specificity testis-specific protein kinase 2 [Hypsibius exemplaris]|uniref:Dual specificity testis-specific protein kinase 2 n=1 Tax=Hypsibius exemplaris TaxID=2072580 RepID=A0A1W0X3V6_HYPEX|nr:Dual specificity testis-specific protein kinase 2 [Hypsibius exemplaris]